MKFLQISFIYLIIKTTESKIVFDIFADKEPTITFSGTSFQNSTYHSDIKNLFGLDKWEMKDYVSEYFNGTKPKSIRYRPTSSSEDAYKRNNWEPVIQVVSVTSASKKSVFAPPQPTIVFSRTFSNPTNESKKVNAAVEMPVAIALKTVWKFTDDIEPEYDSVFDINVKFPENSGTSGITHTSTLAQNSEVYERVSIGRVNNEVELKPGQTITAKFSTTVCNLEMKAKVQTAVSGNMLVRFAGSPYKAVKIEDVLQKAGVSPVSELEQNLTIKIDFYFNTKVELFDKATGLPL